MKYNPDTGYLGYYLSNGKVLFDASVYDRVLVIKKDGSYFVTDVPDKLFVGKGMLSTSVWPTGKPAIPTSFTSTTPLTTL